MKPAFYVIICAVICALSACKRNDASKNEAISTMLKEAKTLETKNDMTNAYKIYEKILQIDPYHREARNRIDKLVAPAKTGDFDTRYERAIRIPDPSNIESV